jgi:hypothetical protein
LFFHFANLYDGSNGKHLFFRKRYDDICTEWLGGLTILKHKSKIIGEQLGQHIDQLVAAGFLASYMVKKAENRDGFVIVIRPGVGFFEDYERFYRRRHQGELQWAFHDDRQQVSEPLKVAYLFTEKRTGHPSDSIAFVPSKDVETAKLVLATLGFDEVPAFLDYVLAEAKKTNFDIKTLGGTKQYLASFLALRQRKAADQAQQAARKVREKMTRGTRPMIAIGVRRPPISLRRFPSPSSASSMVWRRPMRPNSMALFKTAWPISAR